MQSALAPHHGGETADRDMNGEIKSPSSDVYLAVCSPVYSIQVEETMVGGDAQRYVWRTVVPLICICDTARKLSLDQSTLV